MKIIIMRHGQAAYAGLDSVLTSDGKREAECTAIKLAARLKITKVYASPKTRAQQTAAIVCSKLKGDLYTPITLPELTPAGNAALALEEILATASDDDHILLVSHIPLVESLALYLCPGMMPPLFVTAGALIISQNGELWHPEAFISPSAEHALT